MGADHLQNFGRFLPAFQREVSHTVVHRQSARLIPHINRYRVIDGAHTKAAPHWELLGLAVGQHAGLVAVGAVVDVLQRAGTGDHQRHMAVHQHAGGHRPAVMSGRNGADVAVLHLGQDEHGAKAVVRVELRGQLVRDVQAKASAHGQAPAQAQVGDIAHLIACKTGILRDRDAAGGILFQLAKHDPGQFQKGLCPPFPGHAVGLRNGQDEILDAVKRPLRHLLPALKPGTQGTVGRQSAQRQGRHMLLGGGPRAQHFPLFEQGIQRFTAQLVHRTARDKPRPAVHFHGDILIFHRERRAAGLGKAAVQAFGGIRTGRLRLYIPIGKGLAAVCIGDSELFAALFNLQLHLYRHAAALTAVKFPQHGQGLFGLLGICFAAHAEHGAVDLSIQIAGGEAGTAESILQQVAVVGAALAACQTGADCRRHILRRAQTALDFCRCHAKRLQLVQLINDRIIL